MTQLCHLSCRTSIPGSILPSCRTFLEAPKQGPPQVTLPQQSTERGQLLQPPRPILAQLCSGSGDEACLSSGTILGIYRDWAPNPAMVKSLQLGAEGDPPQVLILRTTYQVVAKALAPKTRPDLELVVQGYWTGPTPGAARCVGPEPEPRARAGLRVTAAVCPLCPELWDQSLSIHILHVDGFALHVRTRLFSGKTHVSRSELKRQKSCPSGINF